jgi:hypothetical protein
MNTRSSWRYLRLASAAALVSLLATPARAQFPSIDAIAIAPPSPTVSDEVRIQVSGIHDTLGNPFYDAPWRRLGSDIQLDLLFLQLGIAAPPIPGPYFQERNVGLLPVGNYHVRVRTFTEFFYADPWTFPEVFPAVVGAGPDDVAFHQFSVVVPEPATMAIALAAAMTIAGTRRRVGVCTGRPAMASRNCG